MNEPVTVHQFRVRFPVPGRNTTGPDEVEVRGTVNLTRQTITVDLPGRPPTALDPITARALYMVLWPAVFGSLGALGPMLRVETNTGTGWQMP